MALVSAPLADINVFTIYLLEMPVVKGIVKKHTSGHAYIHNNMYIHLYIKSDTHAYIKIYTNFPPPLWLLKFMMDFAWDYHF